MGHSILVTLIFFYGINMKTELKYNKSSIYLLITCFVLVFSNQIPALINAVLVNFNYEIAFRPMIIIALASFYLLPLGFMCIGLKDIAAPISFCVVYVSKGIIVPLIGSLGSMDCNMIISYIFGMALESIAFGFIGVGISVANKNLNHSALYTIVGAGLILLNSPLLVNYTLYAVTGDISHVYSLVDSLPSNY